MVNDAGKDALFEAWGYSIYDAEYIKSEIERQALSAYQCGDYILGSRNEYGQRINTVIHLKNEIPEQMFLSYQVGCPIPTED